MPKTPRNKPSTTAGRQVRRAAAALRKPKRIRRIAPERPRSQVSEEVAAAPEGHDTKARGSNFRREEVLIAGVKRVLDVFPDLPDLRDRHYAPTLSILRPAVHPPVGVKVQDQGSEGACTGFGLATVIDILNATRARLYPISNTISSSRMAYEMAKLHDEWKGINYDGSSVRGAVKGFYHNGICSEELAPYVEAEKNWTLSIAQAKEAHATRLGAYYRLQRSITDFHAALNETGAVYASAQIHEGWTQANGKDEIPHSPKRIGGHAFAVVGYDDKGFFVQNSWGRGWGKKGIARWLYTDWADTFVDAWVLQLSVPTPEAFFLARTSLNTSKPSARATADVRRGEIIGHFINIDDGHLQEEGKYATPLSSVMKTADRLKEKTAKPLGDPDRKHDHLTIYAHGGLNSLDAEAARIDHLTPGFTRNRIYNYHLMWGTSAFDLLWDKLVGAAASREKRVGSLITDLTDQVFETILGGAGKLGWSQVKTDAEKSFSAAGGGTKGLKPIIEAARGGAHPMPLHLIGHSAGSILLGKLLDRLIAAKLPVAFASVHLMAPACSCEFFQQKFAPLIGAKSGPSIKNLYVYNLNKDREVDDHVGPEFSNFSLPVYFKSLLYLVSNAFEEKREMPLAGMERFASMLSKSAQIALAGADKDKNITNSKTHGGFDNDETTMNTILERILGAKPKQPFRREELIGF